MSHEIKWAFAHPTERSEGTAPEGPLDRISLRDHIVDVEIGAFQAERGTTQRICFNIVVEVRPLTGPVDDDVDRILSYDKVTEAIAHELAAERLNLLETLADRIAQRILTEPQAERVFVRIEKLDRGPGALGVEIVRSRAPRTDAPLDEERPHPQVVYLSNAAIQSPLLSGWIDQLQAEHRPTILCIGTPDLSAPHADHPLAQRRIDLLSIEQNAWVLAARDSRCMVVNTRTELDWAMKNDQISVWAPSKIVLDAVDGPSAPPHDALALVLWFARQIQAADMLVIGEDLPDAPDLPLRVLGSDVRLL
ncbi:bifunctional dihydroneopterin aldolase/dihydroneopterin triphosphate 2'-epimerase [Thalassovita gelatinovora]|uniref:dihydroneopterin aldolase n=1 Tax=Thalassovita gelatinovora TaxID=53501 RepID=A0A0P1FBP9_THAGE|nr:dihydroneopterin aldolase [Thalassovita gelatinovora]QIZ79970.1 diguanylate cyclase [Thalassovita gelatinovora]CUH65616.1 bifunctional dihydroneopterin aldolase/dihydroneopterin triphosphate 2'-epimerase [Thalassovita gelatinovora]SER06149.1 dihydroneopterin aldolase [Thalassovita gelatinovora]